MAKKQDIWVCRGTSFQERGYVEITSGKPEFLKGGTHIVNSEETLCYKEWLSLTRIAIKPGHAIKLSIKTVGRAYIYHRSKK